jgi:hexulose-6-phosphate isomerase
MTPDRSVSTSRRDFLQASALALAAGFTRRPAFARERPISKAIMHSTIGVKGPIMDKYRAVAAAGFAGVEPMGGLDRAEVLEALKENQLKAASVCCHTHWAKPLSAAEPPTRQTGLDGLILSLQDAQAYGATSVLLVPGVARDGITFEQCWERSIPEIKKAIPVARDMGVKIAIENVWNEFITTPKQAVDYLDAIGSEWVGWHFDIGNVGRYRPAEEWIPVIGKRILKLHIKEFNTKAMAAANEPRKGFGSPLLEGTNDWPAIMAALDQIGYSGWAITEQPGGGSPEGLRDLSTRVDRILAL